MIEKISRYFLERMKRKDPSIEGESEEVLLFGITRIIEEIPKTIVAIMVCYFLGILKEAGILLIVTFIYKKFVGGVHAKTNIGCLISGLVYICSVVYGAKYIIATGWIGYLVYAIIYVFSIFIIYKYAPADTEEIPIINKELRRKSKIKAFILLNIIYIVTLVFIKDVVIINIVMYTILAIDIMTTRILYKIFKSNYGHEVYNEKLEYIKGN